MGWKCRSLIGSPQKLANKHNGSNKSTDLFKIKNQVTNAEETYNLSLLFSDPFWTCLWMPQCSCCCSAAGHETDSKSSKKWTSEREDLSKLTLAVVAVEAGHFVARYSPLFHSEPGCWFAVSTLPIHFDFRSPWWKERMKK